MNFAVRVAGVFIAMAGCGCVKAAVIEGVVSDQDGKPLRKAHAMLFAAGEKEPRAIVKADIRGAFRLETSGTELMELRLVGLGCDSIDLPYLPADDGITRVQIRLEPKAYFVDVIGAILSRPHFPENAATTRLGYFERQSDGSLAATLKQSNETLRIAVKSGVLLNYFGADDFELDRVTYDDYLSVIKPTKVEKRIVIRREQYPRRKSETKAEAQDKAGINETLFRLGARYHAVKQARWESGLLAAGYLPIPTEPVLTILLNGLEIPFKKELDAERRPIVREKIARTLFALTKLQPAITQAGYQKDMEVWLESIPVTSVQWFTREGASTLGYIGSWCLRSEAMRAYTWRFFESGAPDEAKRNLAIRALNAVKGDEADFNKLYSRMVSDFADAKFIPEVKDAFSYWFKQKDIQTGAPVPPFTVRNFRDDSEAITNQTLEGRVYLMEFWATWCGWCIKGIPELQGWYEKYKDRGFTIVSFSSDDSAEKIRKFHAQRYPMPWLNAWVGKGSGQEKVITDFGVNGYPRYYLVSEGGRIVCSGDTYEIGKKLEAKFGY